VIEKVDPKNPPDWFVHFLDPPSDDKLMHVLEIPFFKKSLEIIEVDKRANTPVPE
jgi:hypothetical protein